jgi:multimeric flavodoxin WrbA
MAPEVSRRRFLGTTGSVVVGAASVQALERGAMADDEADKITILGICCSPRKGRTTHASLKVCLNEAQSVSDKIEVKLIELAGKKINGSVAAGIELEPGERDDFPALVPTLTDSKVGGVIIGTPVYFGCMTSLCKAFLERCMTIRKKRFRLVQ